MTQQTLKASPRLAARIAGGLYLVVVIAGSFALYTSSGLNLAGDPATIPATVQASEQLFRFGIAANFVASAAYLGVTAILYGLLKPVNRSLSLLAAFFSVVGSATTAIGVAHQLAPLMFYADPGYATALGPEQLQAAARMSLRMGALASTISLMFYGFYCLSLSYLIFGSRFLPRLLGVALLAAGAGWLTGSFATLLSPPLGNAISSYLVPVSGIGELIFTLWILVMGVNETKWREQAGVAERI